MANQDKKSRFDFSKKPEENPDHLIEDYGPEQNKPVEDPIMETEEIMGVPEPPKPKKSNFWLWAIVAMAIILAFILLVIMPQRHKEAEPVKTHSEISVIDQGPTDSTSPDSAIGVTTGEESVSASAAASLSSSDESATTSGTGDSSKKETVTSGTTDSAAGNGAGVSGDIEELARKVIRGQFGDGNTRRQQLGDKYAAVQARVNQLLR